MRFSQIPSLVACLAGLAMSCASTTPRHDPTRRADLLGFTPGAYLVLDRAADGRRGLRAIDLPHGPERAVASSPRISDPQATRWAVAEAKARGWIGQAPLPDHRVDGLRFELVQRRPVGARGIAAVVVTDGIATTEVLQLAAGPRGSLTLGPIWRALRGPWLVVAVDQGRRRSLHVVDLGQVRGRLYNRRGLARFADGDLTDAATLWEQAIAADPGLMDPVYNLACLHTQQGDLERAETELRWALAMSRTRALRLARGDPDLARLRTVPSVGSLLGIVPPDRD